MGQVAKQIVEDLRLKDQQVSAVLKLLEGGATVPFISRYRKEATGGLDEVQVADIQRLERSSLNLKGGGSLF